jgi:hypothetical protein
MKRRLTMLIAIFAMLPIYFLSSAQLTTIRAAGACTTQTADAGSAFTLHFAVNAGDTVTVNTSPLTALTTILFPDGSFVNSASGFTRGTTSTGGTATMVILFGSTYTMTICPKDASTHSGPCPLFWDGRLNDCDAGQTAAIYCEGDGSVTIYAIYAGTGYKAFSVSLDEIAQIPTYPQTNTLIKENMGARLYRLTSGWLQLNRVEDGTANDYRFIFADCPVTP